MNTTTHPMNRKDYKIYCAGPLFNPKEQEEMESIASVLKKSGYNVFLPQEDGLELAHVLPELQRYGIPHKEAASICNKAIFALDVFQIMTSHGLVLNMNGRVPDEGAMVEAGIAWAHGKTLAIFNTDKRTLVQGNCNPMVMGLSNFESVSTYEDLPIVFDRKFSTIKKNISPVVESHFDTANKQGKTISEYLTKQKTTDEITKLLIALFAEVSCQSIKGKKKSFLQANMQP